MKFGDISVSRKFINQHFQTMSFIMDNNVMIESLNKKLSIS